MSQETVMEYRTCEYCLSWKVSPAHRGFCHCRTKGRERHMETNPGHHCAKWEAVDGATLLMVEGAEKMAWGLA